MSEEVASVNQVRKEPEPADGGARLVQVRCGFAELAQLEAEAASDRAAEARRLYDEQAAVLIKVQAEVDPSLTQIAKDTAHSAFRTAVGAARSRGQVETAAVAWLAEINRVNGQNRLALARVQHEHAVADALQKHLTKLSVTAEATAAMAIAAAEACREAVAAAANRAPGQREDGAAAAAPAVAAPAAAALAQAAPAGAPQADGAWTPEVAELSARAARRKAASKAASGAAAAAAAAASAAAASAAAGRPAVETAEPAGSDSSSADEDGPASRWLVIDLSAPRPQAIVKLVRRDGNAMSALVDRLCGGDPTARYDWQVQLSNLVDAIVAAAIDDGWFEFDPGNPFWDQFHGTESREIAGGLAALGFRYDGFGGFVDGRVPTNRDLALAVGQVGLLPVKIRHWPSGNEAAQLFSGVQISADKFLAARAPSLTLGELVRVLGRRAEPLTDLWNNWPRCRPLLFSTAL